MVEDVSSADRPRRRDRDDAELLQLALRFSLHVQASFAACVQELGLSHSQALALQRLDEPLSMRALASCLGCDASNVTGLADRLEERGLVRRESDPRDRRVKTLVVTRRGNTVRMRLRSSLAGQPGLLGKLSAAERRQLAGLLRRVLDP